ncbi:MAG: hypothetical protein PHG67_02230 [Bacteroidales bacterium]|jgi:hypothetical protein|nr:hypothetical protein [Bacteroidales bacterium]
MSRKMPFNTAHKMLEREVLEVFKTCYSDFPKARIKTFESPDFQLIVNRHKTIGLEIVRYVTDPELIENSDFSQFEPQRIQELIEKKEQKSLGYNRMRYYELWLLIVSGSNPLEPVMLHPENIDSMVFDSVFFEKIFYLDMRRTHLYYLQD